MDPATTADADTWSADTTVLTADLSPDAAPTEPPFMGVLEWPKFKKQRAAIENDEALLIHLLH